MLEVKQNCWKEYEYTISAFEASLGLEALVIYIQKSFFGKKSLAYARFNLYWPSGIDNCKDMQVLIAVKKDILNKIIIENQTDLANHPYCVVLDIKKLNLVFGKYFRTTRVLNLYDNKIGNRYVG